MQYGRLHSSTYAACWGKSDILQLLVEEGADVNAQEVQYETFGHYIILIVYPMIRTSY